MFGRRREKPTRPAQQWTRQRMLALLLGAIAVGMALLGGLGLGVVYALRSSGSDAAAAPTATGTTPNVLTPTASARSTGDAGNLRNVIADQPMRSVGEAAARPGTVAADPPKDAIALPAATRTGPAGVPTGFLRTREGAVAQLAAIDQTVWRSASYETATEVVTAWAMPGGPKPGTWTTQQGLVRLFTAARPDDATQFSVILTPLMGQIKGALSDTSGKPTFVVPCIDFELDVTLQQTARSAVADCQRMQWTDEDGGRWMIGPGPEPSEAPAVWPGTDLSFEVGYRFLKQEPGDA
jgi:hypothetical protein